MRFWIQAGGEVTRLSCRKCQKVAPSWRTFLGAPRGVAGKSATRPATASCHSLARRTARASMSSTGQALRRQPAGQRQLALVGPRLRERDLPAEPAEQTKTAAGPRFLTNRTSSHCPVSGWNGCVTTTNAPHRTREIAPRAHPVPQPVKVVPPLPAEQADADRVHAGAPSLARTSFTPHRRGAGRPRAGQGSWPAFLTIPEPRMAFHPWICPLCTCRPYSVCVLTAITSEPM